MKKLYPAMAGFFAPLLLMAFALLPNPDQSSKKHFLSSRPKSLSPLFREHGN